MGGEFSELVGSADDLASWAALLTSAPVLARVADHLGAVPEFHGFLSRHVFEHVSAHLVQISAASHTLRRTEQDIRATPEPRYLVAFQVAGQSIVRQSDSEARLAAGDSTVLTSTVPYEWRFEATSPPSCSRSPSWNWTRRLRHCYRSARIVWARTTGSGRLLPPFVSAITRHRDVLRGPQGPGSPAI